MGMHIDSGYGAATVDCMETVGKRIRDLRKARGLNQTELAGLVGVDQSTISDIERDETVFNVDILRRLSIELDAPADYFLRGNDVVWPFQKIGLSRVLTLKPEDRAFVEGGLSQILNSLENPAPKPAETGVTQPSRYSDPREAKKVRQSAALPPMEDGDNAGSGSNRRPARGKGR